MRWLVMHLVAPFFIGMFLLLGAAYVSIAVSRLSNDIWGGAVLGYYLAYHGRLCHHLFGKVDTWFGWSQPDGTVAKTVADDWQLN